MIREGVFKPRVGVIGALGISMETSADLGKERRTTTRAPPGEMLMAVANSRESLPFPSRARIKTGMASCNRAHLRSSFFEILRGTCLTHYKEVRALVGPHLRGQTSEGCELLCFHPKSRLHQADYRSDFTPMEFHSDYRSELKSATFFPSVPV
jgi:hypothetical protein